MSVTSEVATDGLSQWLKSNALVVLTILGVLLYAVFSIPALFFYARLGTTPSEVGFTYASILSGATLGVLVILAALIFIIYFILFYGTYLLIGVSWLAVLIPLLFHPQLLDEDRRLDANQFATKLRILERVYRKKEPSWTEMEHALRRMRELSRLENQTPAEAAEMRALRSQSIYSQIFLSLFSSVRHWLRPRPWYVLALFLIIILSTGLLTLIARAQADLILQGKTAFGSEAGLFDYHAEIVNIRPVSAGTTKDVQELEGERIFLLGQNAQYIILYLPESRSTIRIPVNAVIVTSSP